MPGSEDLLLELATLRRRLAEVERALGMTTARALPTTSGELEIAAYQLLSEYSSDFHSVHGPSGDYLFASPNCRALFGWEPAQLVGHNAYEFFHEDDLARIAKDHAKHERDEPGAVRYRLRCADGSYRWVETRSRARIDVGGVQQIIASTRDVQDEVLAELRADSAERDIVAARPAELLGQLYGALSHELNNPLLVIELNLSMLGRRQEVEDAGAALMRIRTVLGELELVAASRTDLPQRGDLLAAATVVVAALQAYRERLTLAFEPIDVSLNRALLCELLHAVLLAHLEGCSGNDHVIVKAERNDAWVLVTIEGGSQIVRRVRADLFGVLRGDAELLEGDLPTRLAMKTAARAGVDCEIDLVDGVLRTVLKLPAA